MSFCTKAKAGKRNKNYEIMVDVFMHKSIKHEENIKDILAREGYKWEGKPKSKTGKNDKHCNQTKKVEMVGTNNENRQHLACTK